MRRRGLPGNCRPDTGPRGPGRGWSQWLSCADSSQGQAANAVSKRRSASRSRCAGASASSPLFPLPRNTAVPRTVSSRRRPASRISTSARAFRGRGMESASSFRQTCQSINVIAPTLPSTRACRVAKEVSISSARMGWLKRAGIISAVRIWRMTGSFCVSMIGNFHRLETRSSRESPGARSEHCEVPYIRQVACTETSNANWRFWPVVAGGRSRLGVSRPAARSSFNTWRPAPGRVVRAYPPATVACVRMVRQGRGVTAGFCAALRTEFRWIRFLPFFRLSFRESTFPFFWHCCFWETFLTMESRLSKRYLPITIPTYILNASPRV